MKGYILLNPLEDLELNKLTCLLTLKSFADGTAIYKSKQMENADECELSCHDARDEEDAARAMV